MIKNVQTGKRQVKRPPVFSAGFSYRTPPCKPNNQLKLAGNCLCYENLLHYFYSIRLLSIFPEQRFN